LDGCFGRRTNNLLLATAAVNPGVVFALFTEAPERIGGYTAADIRD
jgi:hypothetical protein